MTTTAAILDSNNLVINIIVADPADVPGSVNGAGGAIGDTWDGMRFVRPVVPPHPPVVPPSVTMRQARLALLGAGLLVSVDAAINALPSPQKEAARIEWEYATEVQRSSGLVPMMAAALGLDDTALDALFIGAAAL